MRASGAPDAASTTRPFREAVGASTTVALLAPASTDAVPRPLSPASATITPGSEGNPSTRKVPSARASCQREVLRPSKRTSAPARGRTAVVAQHLTRDGAAQAHRDGPAQGATGGARDLGHPEARRLDPETIAAGSGLREAEGAVGAGGGGHGDGRGVDVGRGEKSDRRREAG